jgi:transposase-like protein
MEAKKERQALTKRKPAAHFYDVRLIKEIVQAVEDGTPRSELYQRYGFSDSTLCNWMKKYGSPGYHQRKLKVYKPSEKRSVLRAIASGMSITEARISFGIVSSTSIRSWMKEDMGENDDLGISNSHPMAKQAKTKDSEEVKALKEALAFEELKNKALNTMIDIAEAQFKIDIRKKSGARQSPK